LKENNLTNWFGRTAESLLPLYHLLQVDVLVTGYIQADETRIQVLAKLKKNASHRGQMWVYFAPTIKATFFNYESTRSTEAAEVILGDYQGVIQSDGYSVYQKIGQQQGVEVIHCMAHARRKFFEAKENEPESVNFILSKIQFLYKIEQKTRDENLTYEERYQLRQEKAFPILKEIKEWLVEKSADRTILPKSKLKIALNYTLNLWKGLEAYAHDGKLEIDNNLVENTIRPVALGRKNYLFAGSHQAAQNLAIFYSIVGTCEKNNINVYQYLNWLLRKIATEKITPDAVNWLPHRVDPTLLVK
jgi:transposase